MNCECTWGRQWQFEWILSKEWNFGRSLNLFPLLFARIATTYHGKFWDEMVLAILPVLYSYLEFQMLLFKILV